SRTKQGAIDLYVLLPVEIGVAERHFNKLTHRVLFAGGDHIIVRIRLLQHQPHCTDIISGEAPIPLGIKISDRKILRQPELNLSNTKRYLANHELKSAPRRLVVKKNSRDRKEPVALTVVHRNVVAVYLRDSVRRARVERGKLTLWCLTYLS